MSYDIEPVSSSSFTTISLSRRSYIGLTLGIVSLGFLIMSLESLCLYSPSGVMWMDQHPDEFMVAAIVSFVVSLAGIVMIWFTKRNLVVGIVGYIMMTSTLGFTTSSIISYYEVQSIISAFCMTCAYSVAMTCVGFLFPSFFSRIYGLMFASLIGVVIAVVVGLFTGFPMSWLDWFILVLFGGFIAFDSYQMANDDPTVANSIRWATDLYLDIVNILTSILQLSGTRRSRS